MHSFCLLWLRVYGMNDNSCLLCVCFVLTLAVHVHCVWACVCCMCTRNCMRMFGVSARCAVDMCVPDMCNTCTKHSRSKQVV